VIHKVSLALFWLYTSRMRILEWLTSLFVWLNERKWKIID